MAARKTIGPRVNKTKFVLGQAWDLSAKEVGEEARKLGITITAAHVYRIRSTARAKGKGPDRAEKLPLRGRPPATADTKATLKGVRGARISLETQFLDAAIGLGLSAANELLDRLRSRVKNF